ncbi:MAG: hypothetical protein H6599_08250 [Flavobacteriales bacterium]|nr:hypothetical protein [Flavobacteriales bacterium]
MKLQIEQIELQEHLLIYSSYHKDTVTLDEDGTDYEYDFQAFMANLDHIQNTILRLYGEQGLLNIMGHYADGAEGVLSLQRVEYIEDSPVLKKIRDLQQNKVVTSRMIVQEGSIKPKELIPTDDVYLLHGWLDALPVNDDLNVLKMVGTEVSDLSPDIVGKCEVVVKSVQEDVEMTEVIAHQFSVDSGIKYSIITKNQLFLLDGDKELIVVFPGNEFQQKQSRLFKKLVQIKKVYKLKNSIILEMSLKEGNYLLHFNVLTSKFESKKQIHTT